jgi:Phosphotransferase enzyme family
MILTIRTLVKELRPDLFRNARVSVACIRTTQKVFLVFSDDVSRPICVAHVGDLKILERIGEYHRRLCQVTRDLVPEHLVYTSLATGEGLLIVSGLPGTPWFRLTEQNHRPEQWDNLRTLGLATLARFQRAVEAFPDWHRRIRPGDELRRVLGRCLDANVTIPSGLSSAISEFASALDAVGELDCYWQHGDYCLNNLLIDRERVGIIDFEEFGHTCMPLHDEFGLALSIHGLESERTRHVRLPRHHVGACIQAWPGRAAFSSRQLSGLLYHHLLFRIAQCLGRPRRLETQLALVETALWFSEAPHDFLSETGTR